MALSSPATSTPTRPRELEQERLARLERVTAELRALARDAQAPPGRRAALNVAVHDWTRDVAAARRRLRLPVR